MNRWIISLSLVLLVACQTGTTESGVEEQAVATNGDCIPGNNFAGAKLPALPLWNGSKPTASPGQIFLDVADWRPNTQTTGQGFHVAVLVDPGYGKFLWGATIPDAKLQSYRASVLIVPTQPQVGDCCHPPPCGCRTCCDPGLMADWMARNFQESGLRYVVVPDNGANAAGKPNW